MATPSKLSLDELATSIVKCFPSLNLLEQRLSLELYRLLAEGQPVPRTALAKQLEISIETSKPYFGRAGLAFFQTASNGLLAIGDCRFQLHTEARTP